MGHLTYKGYIGSVEYSEEDDCLFGKVLGMSNDAITYEGTTLQELKNDFESAIDFYLESCEERGVKPRKSFSGTLNIRISSEIHSKIALLAEKNGISINAFINEALSEQVQKIHYTY